ncbi:MAG: radical SAM protein [Methanobacteriota archaeon]|nr:MAG: radical SAM protein [Euryarchaeota archaeon]
MKTRLGPDGILFFNRNTGINLLVDEIKVPKHLWALAPRHISIAVTNACDLACPHCFAPKHPAKLGINRVIGWLDELDANGCISVGFGGGEPTLYKSLPHVCEYATQNTGMAVTFTTHGHHIDDQLATALKGNVHFIRVSMDGIGTTYEKIRQRSFSALLQRIETIREIAPFGINYLINRLTFPEIDTAITLAAELGASEFLLLPEVPTNNATGIDKITMQALLRWVSSYDGPIPLTVSEVGRDGMPIADPLPKETGLRAYAHIDASGVLKRSSFDQKGIPIGPGGIMEALKLLRSIQEVSR